MYPVLTFSAGILAGIFGVRWLKRSKLPAGLTAAQDKVAAATADGGQKLREAAVAGLAAVEQSSAKLRGKLAPAPAPQAGAPAAKRAPRRRPAKSAAKTRSGAAS